MEYKLLNDEEKQQLLSQGCTFNGDCAVFIHPELDLKYVREVTFSGTCRLGRFRKQFTLAGGIQKHAGVFHATLHDTTVGDDCCIEHIRNYIANYDIQEDCFLENVDIMLVDGPTAFGNGVEVSVLNETGGREVMIHDKLTAQQAYMEAMCRHRPQLVNRLRALTLEYVGQKTATRGIVGAHSTIVDTGYLKNVYVGPYSKIEGAGRLKNGSLMSRQESPVQIGYGVIMDDFIIQDGSRVSDCSMLSRCYVGQACSLGHGYSASDSLFFCNCQEENGEACAIFAGPFTVTHHKSTLLIAGMFSFMNAGSGSNQSNHSYKLGPIHQGGMERGSKTSSDSYILWPARIGAFSLVMGRHTSHPDTTNMPFSYLIEKNGESYIAPAINLRSVGTIRDAQKWPRRDRRAKEGRLDLVNFNLLSPYTIDRMVKGLRILDQLQQLSGATSDTYAYQSARITSRALQKGISLYTTAIHKFLGNSLISRLEKVEGDLSRLAPEGTDGEGDWLDLAGLIAPHRLVSRIMNDIESGVIYTLQELNDQLADLHHRYYDLEWHWAWKLMLDFYRLDPDHLTRQQLVSIISQWKESVVGLDRMLYADARKEFNLSARTGFGYDGQEGTSEADFEQVRGDFETNSFVQATLEHMDRKSALGEKWIKKLNAIE